MIRLGSLGGYAFSGPRLLGGWPPPARPGVYAVLYRPRPASEQYAVIYVAHADDLSAEGLPFRHRRSPCWARQAGSRWQVHVAHLEVPGGNRPHREQIAHELVAVYRPLCNEQQFDHTWRDEWIGGPPGAAPPSSPGTPPPPAQEASGGGVPRVRFGRDTGTVSGTPGRDGVSESRRSRPDQGREGR